MSLQQKIKHLKNHLKIWNKENFGHRPYKKEELLQKIKNLDEKEAVEPLSEQYRKESKQDVQELASERKSIGVKNPELT